MKNKRLNLNILQDYIDVFGGRFEFTVKWHQGDIYIQETETGKGSVIHFTQRPLSKDTESQMKEKILEKMPGVEKIVINDSVEVTQAVKSANKIDLQNKFKQSVDFEIVLNPKTPAKIKTLTYFGIQKLEHDQTYARALLTTNPYLAIIFNGIRIVPYERDIESLGDEVVKKVKTFAKEQMNRAGNNDVELQFKVEKAFEITLYLDKKDVTRDIKRMLDKQKDNQMTDDEFGFVAYIAFYGIFNGKLNNRLALEQVASL